MLDTDFCDFLERWIDRALGNLPRKPEKDLCCDGVLRPTFEHEYSKKFVNDNRKVVMTAFIGFDGQGKYALTLYFGNKALSRYARDLDVSGCLPDPFSADCFGIDVDNRQAWIQLD